MSTPRPRVAHHHYPLTAAWVVGCVTFTLVLWLLKEILG